jgi:hypothetical protein
MEYFDVQEKVKGIAKENPEKLILMQKTSIKLNSVRVLGNISNIFVLTVFERNHSLVKGLNFKFN